ncbi:DUF7533 family protein [Halocatena pleomorpha]|uniref:Uncharacterized protein n=1 Tax=Halocatena pleomorpha TaxID=1785090 RepID=A0A3P3RA02_9EURY|nr:hypothetical protein [Halocatena pleomorpha]RRJ30322.1 hypothetical protein EIK79_10405 [Halocatena pleomorpha]
MPNGIIDTITLAITVAFALPVGMFGAQFLLSGQYVLGGVFVGIAALMVAAEEYITTPGDLPAIAAQRVVGSITTTDNGQTDKKNES